MACHGNPRKCPWQSTACCGACRGAGRGLPWRSPWGLPRLTVEFTVGLDVGGVAMIRAMVLSWTANANPTAHIMGTTMARAVPGPWLMATRGACLCNPPLAPASPMAVPRLPVDCHGMPRKIIRMGIRAFFLRCVTFVYIVDRASAKTQLSARQVC